MFFDFLQFKKIKGKAFSVPLPLQETNKEFLLRLLDEEVYLDPKNACVFKKVFGSIENRKMILGFLNDVLDHYNIGILKEIRFLAPSEVPAVEGKEVPLVVMLCKDRAGFQYVVEVFITKAPTFFSLVHQEKSSEAYFSRAKKGSLYEDLTKVVFLVINDYADPTEGGPTPPSYGRWVGNRILTGDPPLPYRIQMTTESRRSNLVVLDLPRFNTCVHSLEEPWDKWCYFFKHAPQTTDDIYNVIKGASLAIKQAYEAVNMRHWSEQDLISYVASLKQEEVDISCMKETIEACKTQEMESYTERGRREMRVLVAKKLLEKGFSKGDIKEITGLSEIQVQGVL